MQPHTSSADPAAVFTRSCHCSGAASPKTQDSGELDVHPRFLREAENSDNPATRDALHLAETHMCQAADTLKPGCHCTCADCEVLSAARELAVERHSPGSYVLSHHHCEHQQHQQDGELRKDSKTSSEYKLTNGAQQASMQHHNQSHGNNRQSQHAPQGPGCCGDSPGSPVDDLHPRNLRDIVNMGSPQLRSALETLEHTTPLQPASS